jgi:uncharacterized protein (DUF2267 family)
MTLTGLDTFDITLHKSNEWLHEIMQELHTENRKDAYHALRATLHTLRDRLPLEVGAHLSAQLPILIRGVFYEGFVPARIPARIKDEQDFLDHVASQIGRELGVDTRMAVVAVLKVLQRHVSPGETSHLKDALPDNLATLL